MSYDLYGGSPPHQKHSDTSAASANEIADKARKLRALVFAHIRDVGLDGATDQEIQAALGMEGNTQRPRRRELYLLGRIEDSGRRRLTEKKRQAVVWVVTPDADDKPMDISSLATPKPDTVEEAIRQAEAWLYSNRKKSLDRHVVRMLIDAIKGKRIPTPPPNQPKVRSHRLFT